MIDDFFFVILLCVICVGFLIHRWMSADGENELNVEFIFPVKLEYNDHQWFAWDGDDEFLGQATTKEALMNQIAQDNNFPLEKFQVVYEYPLRTKLRPE